MTQAGKPETARPGDEAQSHKSPDPELVKRTKRLIELMEITLNGGNVADAAAFIHECRTALPKLLDALEARAPAGGEAPEGYKLVPLEPTEEMVAAAIGTSGMKEVDGVISFHSARQGGHGLKWHERGEKSPLLQAWAAMLAAAPATPDLNEIEHGARPSITGSPTLGWNPIETAPRHGGAIILWGPDWFQPLVGKWHLRGWIHHPGDHGFNYNDPTHWQLLPASPGEPRTQSQDATSLIEAARFAVDALDQHLGDTDPDDGWESPLFLACQKLSFALASENQRSGASTEAKSHDLPDRREG